MSEQLIVLYEEENPWRHVGFPPDTTYTHYTQLNQPERLTLGIIDDDTGSGSVWRVIQGEDLKHLLDALGKGYTIEKKEHQGGE